MREYTLQMMGGVSVQAVQMPIHVSDSSGDKEAIEKATDMSKDMASRNYYRFVLWNNKDKAIATWQVEAVPTISFLRTGSDVK